MTVLAVREDALRLMNFFVVVFLDNGLCCPFICRQRALSPLHRGLLTEMPLEKRERERREDG